MVACVVCWMVAHQQPLRRHVSLVRRRHTGGIGMGDCMATLAVVVPMAVRAVMAVAGRVLTSDGVRVVHTHAVRMQGVGGQRVGRWAVLVEWVIRAIVVRVMAGPVVPVAGIVPMTRVVVAMRRVMVVTVRSEAVDRASVRTCR